jgi:hypothetical protein
LQEKLPSGSFDELWLGRNFQKTSKKLPRKIFRGVLIWVAGLRPTFDLGFVLWSCSQDEQLFLAKPLKQIPKMGLFSFLILIFYDQRSN